jgi:hypothetical protein
VLWSGTPFNQTASTNAHRHQQRHHCLSSASPVNTAVLKHMAAQHIQLFSVFPFDGNAHGGCVGSLTGLCRTIGPPMIPASGYGKHQLCKSTAYFRCSYSVQSPMSACLLSSTCLIQLKRNGASSVVHSYTPASSTRPIGVPASRIPTPCCGWESAQGRVRRDLLKAIGLDDCKPTLAGHPCTVHGFRQEETDLVQF